MKQTAVEWLINELDLSNDGLTMKIINQAKEMEKEQIIEAWDDGCYQSSDFPKTSDAENYYNETFKTE
jgi:hypothetical protein